MVAWRPADFGATRAGGTRGAKRTSPRVGIAILAVVSAFLLLGPASSARGQRPPAGCGPCEREVSSPPPTDCPVTGCNTTTTCEPRPNGAACSDGLFCNGLETCQHGSCVPSPIGPCAAEDGDGDCSETCDEVTDSCTANDRDGSICDDGNPCNGSDSCFGGACSQHTGDPCAGRAGDGDGDCSETCDPTTGRCTADDPNGSSCNDGLFCTETDTCSGGSCGGTGDPCAGPDGDLNCAETCSEDTNDCSAPDPAGSTCRAAAGACDVAETCDGLSAACPADVVTDAFTVCRNADDTCDTTETCDGLSKSCPADAVADAFTECRAATRVCDVAETCDGQSKSCPADVTACSTVADHLKCYQVKDPVRLKGPKPSWLDLTAADGSTDECRIVGGFRLVCVPVRKDVTAPIQRKLDGGFEDFIPMPSDGFAEEDKLCYKIRCTSSASTDRDVTDPFGSRTVSKPKPFLLCGPIQCSGGETSCGGVCVDTQRDRENCGGCGIACSAEENCRSGICRPVSGEQ